MERYSGTPHVLEAGQVDPVAEWTVPGGETGLEEPMWQLGLGGGSESYPERPDEADCIYYLRTGFCGYGPRCRFNHPHDRGAAMGALRASRGEYPERTGQAVCQNQVEMSTSGLQFCADGVRWQPDVESAFIDIMYEEVLKGNLLSSTFSTHVWNEIGLELHKRTGYAFSPRKMLDKLGRMKTNWRKYRDLMLSDTGLGWDHELDLPVASPVWWANWEQANPQNVSLRIKPCRGYLKLCSIFARNTATGRRARSSAQIPVSDSGAPSTINEDYIDVDEDDDTPNENTPMESTQMMSGASRRKKNKKDSVAFARLCESIQTTNESFNSKLNEEKKKKTMRRRT